MLISVIKMDIRTKFDIPEYICECIDTIEQTGHEAWCVGGAVRDLCMGLEPHDFDIATSAECHFAAALFPKAVMTGEKHGTFTAVINSVPVEITTFRVDGEYRDNRHPDGVAFVNNLEEDLKRRDFTVNAMAYHPERGLRDPFSGLEDVKKRTLRAVGDPDRRFKEDALRILRLFRFAAQLDFNIDNKTLKAAFGNMPLLKNISAERIYSELKKMLSAVRPDKAAPLFEYGMEFIGLPRFSIERNFCSLPTDIAVRAAALCYLAKADPAVVLHNLKADKKTAKAAIMFNYYIKNGVTGDFTDFKRQFSAMPPDKWVQLACALEILRGTDSGYIKEYSRRIIDENHPFCISDLAIRGEALKKIGFSGSNIGAELEKLLELCIEDPALNNSEKLAEIAGRDFAADVSAR